MLKISTIDWSKTSYKTLQVLYIYKNKLTLSHYSSTVTSFSLLATDSWISFYPAFTETWHRPKLKYTFMLFTCTAVFPKCLNIDTKKQKDLKSLLKSKLCNTKINTISAPNFFLTYCSNFHVLTVFNLVLQSLWKDRKTDIPAKCLQTKLFQSHTNLQYNYIFQSQVLKSSP